MSWPRSELALGGRGPGNGQRRRVCRSRSASARKDSLFRIKVVLKKSTENLEENYRSYGCSPRDDVKKIFLAFLNWIKLIR